MKKTICSNISFNGMIFDGSIPGICDYLEIERNEFDLNEAYSCEFSYGLNPDIIYIEGDEDYVEIEIFDFKPIKV